MTSHYQPPPHQLLTAELQLILLSTAQLQAAVTNLLTLHIHVQCRQQNYSQRCLSTRRLCCLVQKSSRDRQTPNSCINPAPHTMLAERNSGITQCCLSARRLRCPVQNPAETQTDTQQLHKPCSTYYAGREKQRDHSVLSVCTSTAMSGTESSRHRDRQTPNSCTNPAPHTTPAARNSGITHSVVCPHVDCDVRYRSPAATDRQTPNSCINPALHTTPAARNRGIAHCVVDGVVWHRSPGRCRSTLPDGVFCRRPDGRAWDPAGPCRSAAERLDYLNLVLVVRVRRRNLRNSAPTIVHRDLLNQSITYFRVVQVIKSLQDTMEVGNSLPGINYELQITALRVSFIPESHSENCTEMHSFLTKLRTKTSRLPVTFIAYQWR